MIDVTPALKEWKLQTERLRSDSGFAIKELCADAFLIAPVKSEKSKSSPSKSIACTIMAITHGDEVGGLWALNTFLANLQPDTITAPIAVILGNVAASKAGRRYLEKDLNRSFSAKGDFSEIKRAQELADHVLSQTAFLLDIHQTIEPAREPFFIFPFEKNAYLWARTIDSKMAMVTHWGAAFSKDGMCTDAFVNSQGGVGLTVELGQAGIELKQLTKGVELIRAAVASASKTYHNQINNQNSNQEDPSLKSFDEILKADRKIYTWAHTEPYPSAPVQLRDGLFNFLEVKHGESIGKVGGRELNCGADGWLMFPKYNRQNLQPPPAELYRVLKQVTDAEKSQLLNLK